MMMNTATTHVRNEPANVSILPNLTSRTSMPLSTTADCWKKICHGVIVVPMLAMISVIKLHRQATGEVRCVKPTTDRCPALVHVAGLHRPDRRGDIDQIEQAEEQRDLLERPVLAR